MTLFLKIFLWFWLAMALIVAAITLVAWTTKNEPIVRQWQTVVGEVMNVHSQTAAQIYDAQGKAGLEIFLKRLETSQRIKAAGLFDANGAQIAGGKFEYDTGDVIAKTLNSDATEFDRTNQDALIGKKTSLQTGATVVLLAQWERPRPPEFFFLTATQILQILAVILTAGLFCYGLAKYLTSPIVKLRRATRKFADGNLQTRINIRRRDELGGLAEDFDEMAERIETLITSEKRLTQDISHELRSPLARMNVALELVKAKTDGDAQPLINRIEKESRRLNEMIARLLMLSKLETGSENFERREFNLSKIIEQIAADADFEAQANDKSVKILRNDAARIFGSENLVRSAIENVIRNAVKYSNTKTTVEISLENRDKNAVVTIRDYGAGVPEDELENLFRPFYRVHTARERKTGGIGLGLAIAERAVHAHNGKIAAANTANGLTVEIVLPVKN